jgi:carboxyl-terminal processing protease
MSQKWQFNVQSTLPKHLPARFQSLKLDLMRPIAFLGGAIAIFTSISLLSLIRCRPVSAELQNSPKAVVDEVWQIIDRDYVDGKFNSVDWQAMRQSLLSRNYSSREEAYTAIRSALKQLGDPYTRFLDPNEYQSFSDETSGETCGVGIAIKQKGDTGQIAVENVLRNSPASKAGIKAGDEILAIDGKSTQGMIMDDFSKLIHGQLGTPLTLRIGRIHSSFDVRLIRSDIKLPTVTYRLKHFGQKRIGYIHLSEFAATSGDEMRRAIHKLKNHHVNGYVLDLRDDPGGLVDISVEIARMWLDQGVIVREVDRVGNIEEFKANHTALTNKPLVVLVDGDSASASEILTAALKENNRAMVVGSQTFGKALVQAIDPLSDGSALAVTVEHYFTPTGMDIGHKGITPNIRVDLTQTQQKQLEANPSLLATESDPQYASAIAALARNIFASL